MTICPPKLLKRQRVSRFVTLPKTKIKMCSIELRKFEKSPKNENKTKQTKKTSESKILQI